MIETMMFCVMIVSGADAEPECEWWKLFINVPLGSGYFAITISEAKKVYMIEWNACVFMHEYNEHVLKPENNVTHEWSCG